MKHIAFALDPDGYWVELIGHPGSSSTETATNLACYRFNHTMIRVKDPEKSLNFYRSVLGMSLLRAHDNPEARFGLYFLGYRHGGKGEVTTAASAEGVCFPLPPPKVENVECAESRTTNRLWNSPGTVISLSFPPSSSNATARRHRDGPGLCLPQRQQRSAGLRPPVRVGRQSGRCLCALRRPGRRLEEAADGRPHEDGRLHPRPRQVLDRVGFPD